MSTLVAQRRTASEDAGGRSLCLLVAAYAAVTLPPLVRSIEDPAVAERSWIGILLRGATLAGVAWALATRPRGAPCAASRARTLAAAWIPIFATPLFYFDVPAVAAGVRGLGAAPLHDAQVIAWERALFAPIPFLRPSPTLSLARHWPSLAVSELLHASYLAFFALLYVPSILLWCSGRRRAFAAVTATVATTLLVCYLTFLAFPVAGPWYWYGWGRDSAAPDGPLRTVVQYVLGRGASRGAAFPSAHVALSVALTATLARVAPDLARPAALLAGLVCVAVVYGGFHYGVDVLAGAVLGAGTGIAAPRLLGAVGCGARAGAREGRVLHAVLTPGA